MGDMSVTAVRCPKCQAMNASGARVCNLCGTSLASLMAAQAPTTKTTMISPPVAKLMPPPPSKPVILHQCAACNSTDVQKVSAIYASQNWDKASFGGSVQVGHIQGVGATVSGGPNWSRSHSATQLAQWVCPPPEPLPPSRDIGTPIIFALMALFFASAVGQQVFSSPGVTVVLALVAAGVAAWAGYYLTQGQLERKRAIYEQNHVKWQYAMQNWDRLYYCPKCDQTQDPVRRLITPSSSTISLIW